MPYSFEKVVTLHHHSLTSPKTMKENSIYEISLMVINDESVQYPYRCSCWQRGCFTSFDDADSYVKKHIHEWKRDFDVFCIYLRQKPTDMMLYDDESSAVWLYDADGKLMDYRICSNIDMDEPFPWRNYEQQRFHPGDIVEVLQNDTVFLAYIPGRKMSEGDIQHYNDFVKDKVGDASDDIYTVLTTDSYDSHQHIDSLHVFKPHRKIEESVMNDLIMLYKRNLELNYPDKDNGGVVPKKILNKGCNDPKWILNKGCHDPQWIFPEDEE